MRTVRMASTTKRRNIFLIVFLALAVVGLICALSFGVFAKSTSKTPASLRESGGRSVPPASVNKQTDTPEQEDEGGEPPRETKTYTDPAKETYAFSVLAIGDWGSTLYKRGGSCCNRNHKYPTNSPMYNRDKWAQENVAKLMALSIRELPAPPKVIVGHGDNFYWNGVGPKDQQSRFDETFEQKYNDSAYDGIPWVNVLGNHDYGGDGFLCGDRDNYFRQCETKEEMMEALETRFKSQAEYQSPNHNRWILAKHYYKYQVQDLTKNVSLDIFNVDTNVAASHGARQICCQCYGYSRGKGDGATCNNVDRGNPYCMGGKLDWYDTCMARIKEWHDESFEGVQKDAATSTADFKLVNSHYSPTYHFIPERMMKWYNLLKETKIQIFMNGHTHAESHDFGNWGTHFFENGAGGGIQNESPAVPNEIAGKYVKSLWTGGNFPYGFFLLNVSKNWVQVKFITFDDNWVWASKAQDVTVGGAQVDHCWYIPRDGSLGKEC